MGAEALAAQPQQPVVSKLLEIFERLVGIIHGYNEPWIKQAVDECRLRSADATCTRNLDSIELRWGFILLPAGSIEGCRILGGLRFRSKLLRFGGTAIAGSQGKTRGHYDEAEGGGLGDLTCHQWEERTACKDQGQLIT